LLRTRRPDLPIATSSGWGRPDGGPLQDNGIHTVAAIADFHGEPIPWRGQSYAVLKATAAQGVNHHRRSRSKTGCEYPKERPGKRGEKDGELSQCEQGKDEDESNWRSL